MEITSFLRAGFALVIVLGLIALVAYLARRFGLGGAGAGARGERRLSIIETLTLDPKRRVLLIKCDQDEHLILLGPSSEAVLGGAERQRHGTAQSVAPAPAGAHDAQPSLSPASLRAKAPERKAIPQTMPDGRLEPQIAAPPLQRETK